MSRFYRTLTHGTSSDDEERTPPRGDGTGSRSHSSITTTQSDRSGKVRPAKETPPHIKRHRADHATDLQRARERHPSGSASETVVVSDSSDGSATVERKRQKRAARQEK